MIVHCAVCTCKARRAAACLGHLCGVNDLANLPVCRCRPAGEAELAVALNGAVGSLAEDQGRPGQIRHRDTRGDQTERSSV